MKALLVCALFAFSVAQSAFATTEIKLQVGANPATIVIDNGVGDSNPALNTIIYSNASFFGWNISFTAGTSNTPGLIPYGIDMSSLTATSTVGAADLHIWLTSQDFSAATKSFQTDYSVTMTGGGSTTEKATYDTTNALFGTGGTIGTVGPLSATGSGTATGGGPVAPPPNYSLTLEQIFHTNGGTVSFSVDGNITGIPEPAAVMLFGTALALCASRLRKRKV